MKRLIALIACSAATCGTAAVARTQTGTINGLSYTAANKIIGKTSTAEIADKGDPIYLAQMAQYRGVVGLLIDQGPAGQFVCSGSLSADRGSIITAGHCVSDGVDKVAAAQVTALFYDGNASDPDVYTPGAVGVTAVDIGRVLVNPLYTGEVIDDHDIAVLQLAEAAPDYANGYSLYQGNSLDGLTYNTAGYGGRSDEGGVEGVNLGTGFLRQGLNRYDFALGDPLFQGFFEGGPGGFFGTAETTFSYLSDFDSGFAGQDASCGLADIFGGGGGQFCNTGTGDREVSTAGGDSGGPQFVDGQLASVTSYGLSFRNSVQPGDIDNALNSSFGEFNGLTPIFNNLGFLNSALTAVPEPSSWALMIAGLGLVGVGMRRRGGAFAARIA